MAPDADLGSPTTRLNETSGRTDRRLGSHADEGDASHNARFQRAEERPRGACLRLRADAVADP
jgi:hypothetical protein